MVKLTEQSANGTSFHGTTIRTTVNKLVEFLGEPTVQDNTGEDKVNFEWDCETKDGEVFTIYDWKEYRSIHGEELVDFHIGGYNKIVTEQAKRELLDIIK
jgi:PKD repeat protein